MRRSINESQGQQLNGCGQVGKGLEAASRASSLFSFSQRIFSGSLGWIIAVERYPKIPKLTGAAGCF